MLRQALLAGAVLATPFVIFQLGRCLAVALWRHNPRALMPFCAAGGLLALLGVAYAILVEAPRSFLPALTILQDGSSDVVLNFEADYARAALVLAAAYAIVLQLPVVALMMIKSWRTGRALQAEGRA
jgi:sec-independent protein translocase protein TatC